MLKALFFAHRWIGVALALFMFLWLSTGIVISYSHPLALSLDRQLAHEETLNPPTHWLSLGEALTTSAPARAEAAVKGAQSPDAHIAPHGKAGGTTAPIVNARLLRIAGDPYWLIEDDLGHKFAVSALDGALQEFSPERAADIARGWLTSDSRGKSAAPSATYIDTVESVAGLRNADALKPFHRFAVEDRAGTVLVVSSRSGEVLQSATSFERSLYFIGNFLHLFKPLDLAGLGDYRRNALSWAGFLAFIAAITGITIGLIKWKPRFLSRATYSGGRTQPYREFWFKYHFWAGLIGGAFAVIWAGSGYLSTNPWQIFSQPNASRQELARYLGGEFPQVVRDWKPQPLEGADADIVELQWDRLGDDAVLLGYRRDGERRAISTAGTNERFTDSALLTAVQRAAGETKIASNEWLNEYDSYYYAGHGQSALEKPLPVLRVDLADASHTSFYLDPRSGRLLLKIDTSRRAFRWLYTAAHNWDFGWFRERPFWNVWITTWALLGLILATSAVVLAWRRLRRTIPAPAIGRRHSEQASARTA